MVNALHLSFESLFLLFELFHLLSELSHLLPPRGGLNMEVFDDSAEVGSLLQRQADKYDTRGAKSRDATYCVLQSSLLVLSNGKAFMERLNFAFQRCNALSVTRVKEL